MKHWVKRIHTKKCVTLFLEIGLLYYKNKSISLNFPETYIIIITFTLTAFVAVTSSVAITIILNLIYFSEDGALNLSQPNNSMTEEDTGFTNRA